jgi:hypothetical protein
MSFAELKAEVPNLSAGELELLRTLVDVEITRKEGGSPVDMAQYLGCTRGMMKFQPGWEEDEPLEAWEALRDDSSL